MEELVEAIENQVPEQKKSDFVQDELDKVFDVIDGRVSEVRLTILEKTTDENALIIGELPLNFDDEVLLIDLEEMEAVVSEVSSIDREEWEIVESELVMALFGD